MDRSTVRDLAALCKLSLDDAQQERAEARIGRLLEYFAVLQAVDTDGVEPSPYPMTLPHRPRADVPDAVLSQQEVLDNAPSNRSGAFLVPRVVDG